VYVLLFLGDVGRVCELLELRVTLRQTHVIASPKGTSSVDRVLLLPMRRVKETR
jgi:hypothetical protein